MPDNDAIVRALRFAGVPRDPNLQTGPYPQWPTLPPMQAPLPRYLSNDPTAWEGGDFPTRVDPMSIAMALIAGKSGMRSGVPARTGKYGSLPEEAAFRNMMGQQYEMARSTGDLSMQYDILGGRLMNDRSMPAAMRQAIETERARIAHDLGPEGRKAAGIAEPSIDLQQGGTNDAR